jgi:hypothetical protein
MKCWKSKIEREDRIIKSRTPQFGRTTLDKLLECIPVGMHDSFMKPHDIMDAVEPRGRNAPRLYRYYLTEEIEAIIQEYEALTPAPYVEDPTHTAEQKATALANHQALMDGLEDKRNAFFAERKAKNDEHMDQVKKIEAGIRSRREMNNVPYTSNREARKALFTKRAEQDIPNIPTEFVQNTKAFKAATRIFRDGGTERGWQTLKPKIVQEWDNSKTGEGNAGPVDTPSPFTITDNDDNGDDDIIMEDDFALVGMDDRRVEGQTQVQSHTQNPSQSHNQNQTQNRSQVQTQTQAHGQAQFHSQTHIHGQAQFHSQTHIHGQAQVHSQTHSQSKGQPQVHSQSRSQSQSQSQAQSQHASMNHGPFARNGGHFQQLFRQSYLRGEQALRPGSAAHNIIAGMVFGTAPNRNRFAPQNSPHGNSMDHNSMTNRPPTSGRQNTQPGINMLHSNPFGHHPYPHANSAQQVFMNRNALGSSSNMNSNPKMSISSLIQPTRDSYSDFERTE